MIKKYNTIVKYVAHLVNVGAHMDLFMLINMTKISHKV